MLIRRINSSQKNFSSSDSIPEVPNTFFFLSYFCLVFGCESQRLWAALCLCLFASVQLHSYYQGHSGPVYKSALSLWQGPQCHTFLSNFFQVCQQLLIGTVFFWTFLGDDSVR